MELRQIRFAVAVAEERHFGRAAERMFIAQPALSQHVRRLEQEIGARLFDRGARHVRLTPAGQAFLEVGCHLLRQAEQAVAAARRAEAGETGWVSIGASLPVAAPLMSLLLGRLTAVRPAVRPEVVAGRSRELVDLVRRRELDVALVEEPPADARLRVMPVLEDPVVVLLPSRHGLARAENLDLADLTDAGFVIVSRDSAPALHDSVVTLCMAAGMTPRIALEVDRPDLLPVAVAAGLGVALVPRALAMACAPAGATWRQLHDDRASLTLFAVAAAEGATPQARKLLDLAGRLGNHPTLRARSRRHLELAAGAAERAAS